MKKCVHVLWLEMNEFIYEFLLGIDEVRCCVSVGK